MSKNTGIRIETVREINDNGEQGYKITKIQALANKDLPEMYQDNSERPIAVLGTGWANPGTRLYLYEGKKATYIFEWDYIWSRFYSCKDMKKINTHIKAAGKHLADVNAHLAKEREAWRGKVTFVDGEEICNKITKKSIRPWEPWLKKSTGKTARQPDEPTEQLYKIIDGSWNLCSTNAGMEHIPGLKLTNGKYRIISQGCDLPASQLCARTPKRNDTIVQNVDTGQVVFTCERFLCQI